MPRKTATAELSSPAETVTELVENPALPGLGSAEESEAVPHSSRNLDKFTAKRVWSNAVAVLQAVIENTNTAAELDLFGDPEDEPTVRWEAEFTNAEQPIYLRCNKPWVTEEWQTLTECLIRINPDKRTPYKVEWLWPHLRHQSEGVRALALAAAQSVLLDQQLHTAILAGINGPANGEPDGEPDEEAETYNDSE
jgi:hypothetical protein